MSVFRVPAESPPGPPPGKRGHATPAHRAARVLLGTNYAHALVIDLPLATAVLDRGTAELLGDALAGVTDERALVLLGAFRPGLTLDDVKAVRRAIELFEDEMAIEDRRPEPRSWVERAGKPLAI